MKDGAVGRKGESYAAQGKRIAGLLGRWLDGNEARFYNHGLDFGCGWGRISPVLAKHCRHLWCVDLFSDWVSRAAETALNSTGVVSDGGKLPFEDNSFELIVDVMTLQGLANPLLQQVAGELARIAEPGATVISIGIADSEALGDQRDRAKLLNLQDDWYHEVTRNIDEAGDDYLVVSGAAK